MIQLERHIEILLLSNDCVIVPGFGGFMAHHVDARYDEREELFLPPLRTLGFNPQLQLNDSLLAQSYIEAYDISYPEAIKRIASEVEELQQHLADNGSYELNDIGVITLNDDGHYEFTPCEAGILTPSLYGLTSFEMPVIIPRQTSTLDALQQAVSSSDGILPERRATLDHNTTDGASDDADEFESARTISIRVSTLRNLAAACVAVVAFMLFPSQLTQDHQPTAANSQFNTEWLRRVMPKDITTGQPNLAQAQTSGIPEAKEEATPSGDEEISSESQTVQQEESSETAASQETSSSPYYAIVLASQVSKKNAEYFVSQLQKKGFHDASIHTKGKNVRVIFGNYQTENEAYNALRPLRQDHEEFAEGWVMKFD
ncbi:MAG: SPOR domain-containing protein [Prevotella sp.]|nr:SPOR domain-containing protein [Prevotella sp.]